MYCRVLNWMSTEVSEVRAASIIRAMVNVLYVLEQRGNVLQPWCCFGYSFGKLQQETEWIQFTFIINKNLKYLKTKTLGKINVARHCEGSEYWDVTMVWTCSSNGRQNFQAQCVGENVWKSEKVTKEDGSVYCKCGRRTLIGILCECSKSYSVWAETVLQVFLRSLISRYIEIWS
jgi:hypothetical protein